MPPMGKLDMGTWVLSVLFLTNARESQITLIKISIKKRSSVRLEKISSSYLYTK